MIDRWSADVFGDQAVVINQHGDIVVAECVNLNIADHIVYVHNHWPGDTIVPR